MRSSDDKSTYFGETKRLQSVSHPHTSINIIINNSTVLQVPYHPVQSAMQLRVHQGNVNKIINGYINK